MSDEEAKALVRRRLEDAHEALEDAKYLKEGGRSSQGIVNRLYYAMFYAVLALLQLARKAPSKHTGAISLFDTEYVLKGRFPREMSKALHRAFELRQVSDYRTLAAPAPETIEDLLRRASAFVAAVAEYLRERGV